MKNHSKDYNDSKTFILSYKVEDNKIIVSLGSGEIYTVPYTKENEDIIISRMEKQAKDVEIEKFDDFRKILLVVYYMLLPICIHSFIANGGFVGGLALSIITLGIVDLTVKAIINTVKKRDIKRLKFFLENKEVLNDNIDLSENVKLGISEKAIKEIEKQKSNNKEAFNINNIDNYSLNDLKTLRNNIERINSFGFNEEELFNQDVNEEQGLVLKKQ